ncbi:hypothetical protein G7Y89_g8585 [Cudoniella acicularis]|uniref:Uncharacterized protein n=1 Tax=Cudoniella acicularis TaxID=354080 RepID=A0A8H4RIK5_9HELO|nr:hypothetical protein G7Y89_g8585 [Cudoniella acicularis]
MPPKAASIEASSGIALTTKETDMLCAVVSLMGDVPDVSFEEVAKVTGQKYAKNARQACKKLFEKIKSRVPGAPASAEGEGEASGDAEQEPEEPTTPKKKPAKKTAAPKKAPAAKKEKAVGARAAPKKANAGMAKNAAASKKGAKKEDSEEEAVREEEVEDAEDAPAAGEDDGNGKSQSKPVVSSPQPFVSTFFGTTATFPAGYQFPKDTTEAERFQAHKFEMTVEAYRSWKVQNGYDDDVAATPVHGSVNGDEA